MDPQIKSDIAYGMAREYMRAKTRAEAASALMLRYGGDGLTTEDAEWLWRAIDAHEDIRDTPPHSDPVFNSKIESAIQKLEPELMKALLVLAVVHLQRLEVWALSSPMADIENPPPVGFDMANLPPEIQELVIKARESWGVSFSYDKCDHIEHYITAAGSCMGCGKQIVKKKI